MISNISILEDLNINQLDLKKEDPQFTKLLTLWWSDQKMKVLMLNMQRLSVSRDQVYDYYKHIFLSLTFQRFYFNYLNIVQKAFYSEKLAVKCLILQQTADYLYQNKITRSNNFYSIENLTMHCYQVSIVVILKSYINQQN